MAWYTNTSGIRLSSCASARWLCSCMLLVKLDLNCTNQPQMQEDSSRASGQHLELSGSSGRGRLSLMYFIVSTHSHLLSFCNLSHFRSQESGRGTLNPLTPHKLTRTLSAICTPAEQVLTAAEFASDMSLWNQTHDNISAMHMQALLPAEN